MFLRTALLMIAALAAPSSRAGDCDHMPATLATMRSVDQALRERITASDTFDSQVAEMLGTVDRGNTKQLEALLAACGWPVVRDGNWQASDDAWLLAQHADQNRPFQRRALKLLERAVKSGNARGGHLAYLSDRLANAEGRPQLYGTQFKVEGCKLELFLIDSRAAVNQRRAAILGMPTLEAYENGAREHILPPGCSAAK